MTWTVEQFGNAVAEFIPTLEVQDRTKLAALISKLALRGNTMPPPESKPLGDNLFELRTKSGVRVFYTFRPGGRIILLGGIVKKRTKIPPSVLRLMRDRSKAVP